MTWRATSSRPYLQDGFDSATAALAFANPHCLTSLVCKDLVVSASHLQWDVADTVPTVPWARDFIATAFSKQQADASDATPTLVPGLLQRGFGGGLKRKQDKGGQQGGQQGDGQGDGEGSEEESAGASAAVGTKTRAKASDVPVGHHHAQWAVKNAIDGLQHKMATFGIKIQGLDEPTASQVRPAGFSVIIAGNNRCHIFPGGVAACSSTKAARDAVEDAVRAAVNLPRRTATNTTATARVPGADEVAAAGLAAFPAPQPILIPRRSSASAA